MFANIYLNELDQFCKHVLHIEKYIRFVDDVIALFDSKEKAFAARDEIERFLNEELHLELNLPVTFVGALITPLTIRVRKSTRQRMYRRIRFIQKMFEMGQLAWEKVNNTMQSYFGLISHFTAGNLLRKIIDEFSFRVPDNNS